MSLIESLEVHTLSSFIVCLYRFHELALEDRNCIPLTLFYYTIIVMKYRTESYTLCYVHGFLLH